MDSITNNLAERGMSRPISLFNVSLILLVISAILLGITRTVVDPDLWGHLRFGLDTLHNGYLTLQDPYAYTSAGQMWINHEWLAEVLFALAWRAGGNLGLIILKDLVEILILWLAFAYLRHRGIVPLWAAIYVMLFLPIMLPSMATVRPQMFSNLNFAFVLLIIAMVEHGRYSWLWAAPPTICFWVNTHGGVLAGIAILLIWAVMHLLFQPSTWKRVVAPIGFASLALLVNPYGVGLMRFLLQTAVGTRPEITEWAPLQIRSIVGVLYLIGLTLSIAGIVYGGRPKRWPLLAVFAVLALLPLLAVRHLPLFALGAVMLTGEHIDGLRSRYMPTSKKNKPLPEWLGIFQLGGVLLIWTMVFPHLAKLPVKSADADFTFPTPAVHLIKQSGVSGNLMINFNWGEYAIWQLSPRIKVGMDGRRETVYPEKVYSEYMNFHYGIKHWDAILENYPTDMVLVENGSSPSNLLKLAPNWELVFSDDLSTLFVRRDSPTAQPLLKTAKNFRPPIGAMQFP
ncbi:MAG: hypothetical protein P8Z00_23250 [Anaerolineales bacterium]|jgi:hypothetical protein